MARLCYITTMTTELPPPPAATRTCPHCAEQILTEAYVCRYCGKSVRTKISIGQIAGAGLILFVVYLFVMGAWQSWG